MKKLTVLAYFLFAGLSAQAQVELKANPIALLFEFVQASVEFATSEDFGLELDVAAGQDFGYGYVVGKYYFSPKMGIDKFHVGAFGGLTNAGDDEDASAALGFLVGFKAVSTKKLLFEVGLGGGRAFDSDSVAAYFKFHLGYRFGKEKRD